MLNVATKLSSRLLPTTPCQYLAWLVGMVAVLAIGVWNVRIPLGDEGVHILQALKLIESDGWSNNLYYSLYKVLLVHVAPDPVIAHMVMRVIVTFTSTLALFATLRAFQQIPLLAVFIACVAWASSSYVSPYTQIGNNNLLMFSIALSGLAVLLHNPRPWALLAAIICMFWAGMTRPEYLATLAAVTLVGFVWLYMHRGEVKSWFGAKDLVLTLALVAALFGSVQVYRSAPPAGGGLNQYLLQGLGQCYATYYKKFHPQENFDPMTEYQPLLDRTFGTPVTFLDALRNNPKEAFTYFAYNSVYNIGKLIPANFNSKSIPKNVLIKALFLIGTFLGVRAWWRARKDKVCVCVFGKEQVKFLFLIAFLAGSAAAILLLIPDPRYWITWVPFMYLWFAWAVSVVLRTSWVSKHQAVLVAAYVLIFAIPHLLWSVSNREMIYAMRAASVGLPEKPVVAGNFVLPTVTFVYYGNGTAVNTYNGLSPEGLRAKEYDVFISSALEGTARWAKEQDFLQDFMEKPEKFGYRNVVMPDGTPTDIYTKIY